MICNHGDDDAAAAADDEAAADDDDDLKSVLLTPLECPIASS